MTISPALLKLAFNGLLFNISWFAIVYTHHTPIAAGVVVTHLCLHSYVMQPSRKEQAFIALLSFSGFCIDFVMFSTGLFLIDGFRSTPPFWLTALWPVLATTFCHAFSGLQQRLILAAILGAIGGVGSYTAGAGMSPVEFAQPGTGHLVIALAWMFLFPLILYSARWVNSDEEDQAVPAT